MGKILQSKQIMVEGSYTSIYQLLTTTVNPLKQKQIPRYTDFGPLSIEDNKEYLESARVFFNSHWKRHTVYEEKISDFELLHVLGSGSFGEVVLANNVTDKKYFAIKILSKSHVVQLKQIGHTLDEKLVLEAINCPMTIYMVYFFMDNSYLYFVMPYIAGGELFRHLVKFGKFDESQSRFYVAQIVLAVEYLHHLDLVYRDLKPENILIDHTGYLKLADFGFCKRIKKERTYTLCGTPEYLAPEVILSRGYGLAVDWWGIGVLTYELASGYPPFYVKEPMKIYEKIIGCSYKVQAHFSSDLQDLIKNLLQIDLSKRYGNLKDGVDDIKLHKWLRPINWLAVLNRKIPARFIPPYKDTIRLQKNKMEPLKVDDENKYIEQFLNF